MEVIMTDSIRNKVVGVFSNTTEALKYAKQEDIKVVSFEAVYYSNFKIPDCKGANNRERKEVDSSRT